ncbi:Rhythmically expressed gene 2 protein [Cyberlindnera fabianii]|nr:Rhythmically expressed gene 2 protein [Cyberlindnera fabianii]
MKEMKESYPNYGKRSNLRYDDWWATLIANTYSPTEVSKEFVEELVDSFSSQEAYGTYQDVVDFFRKYGSRQDLIIVASSNGDPRVAKVLESLGLVKYFQKVYLSYDLDVSKPDRAFFDSIIDDLRGPFTSRDEMLKNAWHIGDEVKNDLEGALSAGWNSVLIDRKNDLSQLEKVLKSHGEEVDLDKIKINTGLTNTESGDLPDIAVKLDNKRSITSSFTKLPELLGL